MKKNLQHFFIPANQKYAGYMLFFLLGLMCPAKLSAQTDTAKKLKEVKVSSAGIPQIQTIAPSQSINAADFARYSAFTVADAIRNFAGVIVQDYGGIGGLQTVSVRGLNANHTAILYDGVQINDAETGQIDLSKFNLSNIAQIILYNGQPPDICQPAASFASASVLSIKTIKPELTAAKPYSITAGIKTGSFGLINPDLQWLQRINKYWSFSVNGYFEDANGKYKYKNANDGADSAHTRNGADITTGQVEGALYWAKNDSNKFNLHINYYNDNQGIPGAVELYNSTLSGDRLWNNNLFIQAGYEHIWDSGIHLLINTKLSRDYQRYLDPTYPDAEGKIDDRFTQREFYQSAALAYHFTANWEVSYAADFSVSNLDANDPTINYTIAPYPTRFTLLNVLATNLTLGKWHLEGSLLNTHINETVRSGTPAPNRNIYSPTAMATINPFKNSNFQLRGFYKYIFRNPTFNDLYYGGIGNPNLKPEFTNQFDLGLTYSKSLSGLFDYIVLTADDYYNIVTNKIVYIPMDGFNKSIQNFGKVDIEGLNVVLKTQVKITPVLKGLLSVNYSYQDALNVTDPASSEYLNQLPYTPKNVVALNAGVNNGHLGVYYNQILSSSRYYTNNNDEDLANYLPAYSVSDASVVYKFSAKHFPVTASMEVNNLLDKNYVVIHSYPMPGRSYRLSFQITI
jgi:vitamin B12 transporter